MQTGPLKNIFTDECSALPIVNDLQTVSTFPVDFGTKVTVTCRKNLEILGDNVITCVKGFQYEYAVRPQCVSVGESHRITTSIFKFRDFPRAVHFL